MSSLPPTPVAPTIVVCGACNIDLISYVDKFPQPGETVKGKQFSEGFGGKGANQAVMAGRLAGEAAPGYVAMVGKLGQDSFGDRTRVHLREAGINIDHVYTCADKSISSGLAPITVDAKGENQIIIIGGANDDLTKAEVQQARALIRSAKYMVVQLELPATITAEAMRVAREEGVQVILNTAPAQSVDELPQELFRLCDILCPNQPELQLLSGGMPTDTIEQCTAAARKLLEYQNTAAKWTVNQVLVTMGGAGCLLVTPAAVHHEPCAELPGPVVDTVGAGDCFLGAFTYFLSIQCSVPEAMRRANVCAGISVTGKGTQTSYPSRADVPAELLLLQK
jgi:ribokinase